MIQLHVMTGAAAGKRHNTSDFPISVGRNPNSTLPLSDAGVFDRHFEVQFSDEGFSIVPGPNAVVLVNGARTEGALLRNGDVISAGLAQVQFWLGALPQRALRLRETLAWLLIALVIAGQIYLVSRLLEIARS